MGNHISMSQGTSKWFKTIKKVLCGLFFCKICCPYLDIRGLGHVWIVDFEQVEVILQESEWKRFFPEEWLNNGEEDCNGKKE